MKHAAWGLAAFLMIGMTGSGLAQGLKASERFDATRIAFEPGATYGNYTLTITGPHGVHAIVATRSGPPSFDLSQLGQVEDGAYDYNLTAATQEKVPLRSRLDNGRPTGPDETMTASVSLSGRFDVKGGAIVKYDTAAREPAARQK